MNFKDALLATASALVLLGAASGGALGQTQIQQNENPPTYDPPTAFTLFQTIGVNLTDDPASLRVNTIDGGYSDNLTGISHDQQNNGTSNALGIASNVVISTAAPGSGGDVSQQLWLFGSTTGGIYLNNNGANLLSTFRENTIEDSFNGASGIANVQQNNGDGNVLGIGDVVSANIGPNLFSQNGENHDDSRQRVQLDATVTDITAEERNIVSGSDIISERTNNVSGSFSDFVGMASVQQNNGSGNVIQAGNSIVADLGTETDVGASEDASQSLQAFATVTNNSSFAQSQSGPPDPYDRDNTISDSFSGFGGIGNVQQNNGDSNAMNVGNAVRAHFLTADDIDDATNVAVSATGVVTGNNSLLSPTDNEQNRRNTLSDGAFSDGAGLANVQQNNGNNNAMNAVTGIVATLFTANQLDGGDATVDAASTATVQNNVAIETTNVDRVNTIEGGAFNDTAGIATVQQNNGDNNVINASKAIAAGVSDNPAFVGFNGNIVDNTTITAVVSGNTSVIAPTNVPPGYQNTLTDSFSGFTGIKTVQQNNGSNNAIQSSIAVVANVITP
jgi:hypothetical protein